MQSTTRPRCATHTLALLCIAHPRPAVLPQHTRCAAHPRPPVLRTPLPRCAAHMYDRYTLIVFWSGESVLHVMGWKHAEHVVSIHDGSAGTVMKLAGSGQAAKWPVSHTARFQRRLLLTRGARQVPVSMWRTHPSVMRGWGVKGGGLQASRQLRLPSICDAPGSTQMAHCSKARLPRPTGGPTWLHHKRIT